MVLKMDEILESRIIKDKLLINNILNKSIFINIVIFIDLFLFIVGYYFSRLFDLKYHNNDLSISFFGIATLSYLINCFLALIIPIVCYNIYKHTQKCEI